MKLILLIFILFTANIAYTQSVRIPLSPLKSMPAHDLIYKNEVLCSDCAKKKLINENLDLSLLDPEVNSLWNPQTPQTIQYDQKHKTISGEQVTFTNILKSHDLIMRFHAKRADGSIATYYLEKQMHLAHLRKNLLRKLGYQVPAMKRLKTLNINFKNDEDKKLFLEVMKFKFNPINDATQHQRRWIVSQTDLSLEIRDLSQIESGYIIYDFAIGVPAGNLPSRTTRALLLIHSLLDLKESVNQIKCDAIKRDGDYLNLPYFFGFANFQSVHIDDLKWAANLLAPISKDEIFDLVKKSHYPSPVAEILSEKINCRKNHILDLLGTHYTKEKSDLRLHIPPHLKRGKIKKKEWSDQGYASFFSAENKPSPFKDFHMMILAMFQSVGIDSLVGKLNKSLQAFDPQEARFKLAEKEFNEGLNHFIQTGEFMQFPVSAWASPALDGRLILSRDVIIGNYLGTDNLVQLADTAGFSVDAGVIIGLENFKKIRGTNAKISATFTKTFSHIKPLHSLKTVFKEPYQNMVVPLLKMDLRKNLKKISEKQILGENTDSNEILTILDKFLGLGESLLITQRFNKSARGSLNIPSVNPLWGNFANVRLGFGAGHTGVRRLHILRKTPSLIQVFDDQGNGIFRDYSIDLTYLIPVLRINNRDQSGSYKVKYKNLNIDTDTNSNPDLHKNLKILDLVFKKNNFSLIEGDPELAGNMGTLKGDYQDRLRQGGLFFWRKRRLKSYTKYRLKPENSYDVGNYVSYRDHSQTGENWESFVKDIINFYMSKISDDVVWANRIWQPPSETLFGRSSTFELDYEALNIEGELERDYISVTERMEGWSKNTKELIDFGKKINERHQLDLFTEDMFAEIKKLHFYDAFTRLNIYEAGVTKLQEEGLDKLIKYAHAYEKDNNRLQCEDKIQRRLSNGEIRHSCGYLGVIITNFKNCAEKNHQKREMRCWLRLVKRMYKKFNVLQLTRFFGRENIYFIAQVNGFRKESEFLYQPEISNGYGQKDPRNPDGITNSLQKMYSIPRGEFEGYWLRSRL